MWRSLPERLHRSTRSKPPRKGALYCLSAPHAVAIPPGRGDSTPDEHDWWCCVVPAATPASTVPPTSSLPTKEAVPLLPHPATPHLATPCHAPPRPACTTMTTRRTMARLSTQFKRLLAVYCSLPFWPTSTFCSVENADIVRSLKNLDRFDTDVRWILHIRTIRTPAQGAQSTPLPPLTLSITLLHPDPMQ